MINILLMFFMISGIAFADVYVITAKDKSVYSISEQDDAVVPNGYSKEIIKNKMIGDLGIDGDVSDYKYENKKLFIDTKKLSEKRKKEAELKLEIETKKSARESMLDKLKKNCLLTDDEIDALIGR